MELCVAFRPVNAKPNLSMKEIKMDFDYLREWIGKTELRTDVVTTAPMTALGATLDRVEGLAQSGDALPPLWHWLFFLPAHPQCEIGTDGHPRRGLFLPPVPLPRRMWAGGRLTFHQTLHAGETISRVSHIVKVDAKQGSSGLLAFVLVRHEISHDSGRAITEEHDIVYRDRPQPGALAARPQAAPEDHDWSRLIIADAVLLFRYSALTFNGHRIHYDRSYATEIEGYPGLVVHGPLIATLLLDLLRRELPDAVVATYSFRAMQPCFDGRPFFVCGKVGADAKTVRLWAKDEHGWLIMDASATLI